MDSKDPSCLRPIMSKHTRSKYVKGASALFAWHVSRGRRVIVLSPPPPGRFHPSGGTNYQAIEEPILKGGDSLVIEMVHPTVKGAESFRYQMWPADMTCLWLARFGRFTCPKHCWRPVKSMVTLRFRGDKESCRTHGTRDVSPVQATGSGLDVPNSTLRESEARRASKGDVQKTMPSKQRALKEGSVNEKGVKEAVKEEAVKAEVVKAEVVKAKAVKAKAVDEVVDKALDKAVDKTMNKAVSKVNKAVEPSKKLKKAKKREIEQG
jgi:hypothetical protein